MRGTGFVRARAYKARTEVLWPEMVLRPRMLEAEYRKGIRNVKHACLELS